MSELHTIFVGQAPGKSHQADDVVLGGRCGRKLAGLLGISLTQFLDFERFNLNKNHTPKPSSPYGEQKGDGFDLQQGFSRAELLTSVRGFNRYVLLGSKVARCFGFPFEPLVQFDRGGKHFLIVPHPSGINLWWNNVVNEHAASVKLKRFIYAK